MFILVFLIPKPCTLPVGVGRGLCSSRKKSIHPRQKELKIPGRLGGSQKPKNLKQCVKLNWNFQRRGGHGTNSFVGGRGMPIFWTFSLPGMTLRHAHVGQILAISVVVSGSNKDNLTL